MFGRSRSDDVECGFAGEHAISTPRLRIVIARLSQLADALLLARDPQAQYWNGWDPWQRIEELKQAGPEYDPLLVRAGVAEFIGFETRGGRLVAHVSLNGREDGSYDVGGMVDPDFRGYGFGREMLDAVCHMAHQHFGIARLHAGCEVTNMASQRWLASCGFVRTDGPSHHLLPNGRTVESLWWQRVNVSARRRCRANPSIVGLGRGIRP